MEIEDIKRRIFALRDEEYAAFTRKLIPGMSEGYIIGVRTPALRLLAKEIVRAGGEEPFLNRLPHDSFEENLLHAFILGIKKMKIEESVGRVGLFLPFVDNWAVCDQFVVKGFSKYPDAVYPFLQKCMGSDHLYTRRFGIVNAMRFFLDEKFRPSMFDDVSSAVTGDYYVRMAVAWYFATALAKQWDAAFPYLSSGRFDATLLRMTLRKARESFRLSEWQKEQLKSIALGRG